MPSAPPVARNSQSAVYMFAGSRFDALPERFDRFGLVALEKSGGAEIEQGEGIIRRDFQRLVEIGDRPVGIAFGEPRAAALDIGARGRAIACDQPIIIRQRLVRIAPGDQQIAAIGENRRVVGARVQSPCRSRPRPSRPARHPFRSCRGFERRRRSCRRVRSPCCNRPGALSALLSSNRAKQRLA